MRLISRISKKLPKPIKKPLRWLYYKCTSEMDKKIIRDLAEYSNLNQREVIWLLRSAERLNSNLWHILDPKTEKEIEEFYNICPFYIFELAFWHMKQYQRKFRSKIIKLAKGEILDFGGGIGDLCLEISKKKFNVDYADVCGRTFEFAKWRFQKISCRIGMIDLNKDKFLKEYDTIFCIDVVEHISNQKELLKNLATHLKNNGKLIITNLNAPILARHPMHFEMEFNAEKYLNSLGLFKANESWLWLKPQKV